MTLRLRVELYGRLRDAGLGEAVDVEVPGAARAGDVLAALRRRLDAEAGRLDGAVLATDSRVLALGEQVPALERLAVLPPVCGG